MDAVGAVHPCPCARDRARSPAWPGWRTPSHQYRTDNSVIYKGLCFMRPWGIPSMKMLIPTHRKVSHVAAGIDLVFCDFSSRVSKKQSDRLRSAYGLSDRSRIRIL